MLNKFPFERFNVNPGVPVGSWVNRRSVLIKERADVKRNSPEMWKLIAENSANNVCYRIMDLEVEGSAVKVHVMADIYDRVYNLVYDEEKHKFNVGMRY
jgi:hypothetical protein